MTDYADIDIDGVKHTTATAVLLIIEDKDCWVPLSVIHPDDDDLRTLKTVRVALWFAEKEGLV